MHRVYGHDDEQSGVLQDLPHSVRQSQPSGGKQCIHCDHSCSFLFYGCYSALFGVCESLEEGEASQLPASSKDSATEIHQVIGSFILVVLVFEY